MDALLLTALSFGGIVIGAPLLGNLLVNGAKALARIVNAEARVQLVGMLKAALTSAENFPKYLNGKFEIILDVLERIKMAYKYPELIRLASQLQKLQKEGVLIIKSTINIEGKVVEKYQLVFKDSVIAEGTTTKEIREAMEPFFGSGGKVLVEVLEEFGSFKKLFDDIIEHAELGTFANSPNPKISLEPGKIRSGGHGQGNIEILESLGRSYTVEHVYQNGVRVGSIAEHADNFKKTKEGLKTTG